MAVSTVPAAIHELHQSAARGMPFAIAIIDGLLDGIDGLELAHAIRSDSTFTGIRLLLLTSAGRADEPKACRDLDISACLTKPVRQSELFDALTRALSTHRKTERDVTASSRSPFPEIAETLDILLAEDHPVNQKVAVRMLERLGHRVHVVANGIEVLSALRSSRFDIILMDLQMPDLDGFATLDVIRRGESAASPRVPIIALTAHAKEEDRERCASAGFDAYITKPVRQADLRAALLEVTSRRPTRTAVNFDDSPDSVLEHLDRVCGGDDDFARKLVGSFLESAPRCLARIDEAIAAGNDSRISDEAHGLVGISRSVGLTGLASAALAIERSARNADSDAASSHLGSAIAAWELGRLFLEQLVECNTAP